MVLSLHKISSELIKLSVIVYAHWIQIGGYTRLKDWITVLIIGINAAMKLYTMAWLKTHCVTTEFWKHVCEGVKELMMLG